MASFPTDYLRGERIMTAIIMIRALTSVTRAAFFGYRTLSLAALVRQVARLDHGDELRGAVRAAGKSKRV
jgi:hypothetical protein